MRFERHKDPKASMGIGRDAHIKKIILDVVNEMQNAEHPSLRDQHGDLKWRMWTRGIEVHHIEATLDPPDGTYYKFHYQDCNGDEAHIMRTIKIGEKEIVNYLNEFPKRK